MICPTCRAPNAESARFCSHCGTPLAGPRPVEGERKFATVLFADVVQSTALAGRLDPEDWAAIMNGAFGFMNGSVARYGGTVTRLMGDAVLALFGAPVAQEDHAERAVLAGLQIRDAAKEYAAALRPRFDVEFDVRVGIQSGFTVLAWMGDPSHAEYTAMGDTANVAARLQAAAKPGTVVIGPETRRLVRGRFELSPLGTLQLKGKEVPMEAHEVLAVKGAPGPTRGVDGLSSPLVGRDREMAALRERLELAAWGRGSAVVVAGEAGIGKSRLIAELRRAAQGADGRGSADGGRPPPETHAGLSAPTFSPARWLEGRAISYGQSVAYLPWQQVGRALIGATETDGTATVREKLREAAARWKVHAVDLPFLETMMAAETEDDRTALADLSGTELVRRIGETVRGVLRAEIRPAREAFARPHVLVFEDLHWADAASLELLVQVSALTLREPLLLVCVLRPDRSAPSGTLADSLRAALGGDRVLEIALEPLEADDSRELLGNLLHVEDLPEDTRALILARSEGNPFFLEEVLRSLLDQGVIVREGDRWRATQAIADVAIPETLDGVLSSRIDRLPDETKRVTQTAAVLGRIFAHRALAEVCRAAPPAERVDDVDPHLGTLTYEELVRERAREPEREFIFKHALTQEAAYGLLLRTRRRELHARAGRVLEELYVDRTGELVPVLAHHFFEGGDHERAVRYGMEAAERALRLFALPEALDQYERVLQALGEWADAPPLTEFDAILGWTWVRHKVNDYEGVLERLHRAEEIARTAGDRERLARGLTWIANVYMLTGLPSRSMPFIMESRQIAEELGDEQLMLLPYFVATESMADRNPGAAVADFERIVEQARRFRMPEVEGHALAMLAMTLARVGRFDEAERQIALALEAAPRSGSPVKEADVHIAVGYAYYEMDEFEKGLEHTRIGAERSRDADAVECACAGYFGVGMNSLGGGDAAEAIAGFRLSLRFADHAGWDSLVNRIRGGLAAAEFEGGSAESVADLEAALRNARSDRDEYAEALFSEMLARTYLRMGASERADASLAVALDFYRRGQMRPAEARALRLSGEIAEARGDARAAAAARQSAEALRASFREAKAAEVG